MTITELIAQEPERALQQGSTFLQFVDNYKDIVQQYEAAQTAWKAVQEAMLSANVDKIALKDGRGTLTLENDVKRWTVDGKIADRFYKTVLDTTKLNAVAAAGEKLPKHVSYTQGKKFVKRLK